MPTGYSAVTLFAATSYNWSTDTPSAQVWRQVTVGSSIGQYIGNDKCSNATAYLPHHDALRPDLTAASALLEVYEENCLQLHGCRRWTR